MHYDKNICTKLFTEYEKEGRIRESNHSFKIRLFLEKAENSLLIARHHKDIKPSEEQATRLHWNYWAITITYYTMLYAAKAAILSKGYEVKDHVAAQIALTHLLIPEKMEREDLELLGQAHKVFEEEYVVYFDEARTESNVARYSAMKKYTERRVDEIFVNAQRFISKIKIVLS